MINKIFSKYFLIYIFLIFISLMIKFFFPNDYNSYIILIFLAFLSLLLINFIKEIRLVIFLFIVLFLAGSHKEIQKNYFSFMSIMHWNDGIKIFSSVPYNFMIGNYNENLNNLLKPDRGNNSGITEIEEIFNLIKKNNINRYYVSKNLQNKIDESVLFRQRLKEITYPAKMIKKSEQSNYLKFYEIDEAFNKRCNEIDRFNNIKLVKCL